jgi:hypothetical protein
MVPMWGWLAVAGVAVSGVTVWHYVKLGDARDEGRAEVQVKWDRERAISTSAALLATAEARAEEQRRSAAQLEITNEAERLSNLGRAAAVRAVAAGDGLRQRAAPIASACDRARSDPSPVIAGQTAPAPGAVLAGVLQRLDDAAGQLAAFADASRIAGLACERSYDALKP